MLESNAIGDLNIAFGWAWMNLGFISGLLMGIKAEPFGFHPRRDAAEWLGGYSAGPRRLIRLGHIAFIMLSVINILFGMHIDEAMLSDGWKRTAAYVMIAGAIGVPLLCLTAAAFRPAKLVLPIPASAVLLGNLIIAWGFLR